MNKIQKLFVLSLTLCCVAFSLSAQTIIYTCDFESAADQSAWSRNVGARASQLENKWYLGAPGQFGQGGQTGLYVSLAADSAKAIYSATQQEFTTAYVTLPQLTANTRYTIRFDYRIAGSTATKLHAWWVPSGFTPACNTSAAPNYTTRGGFKLAENLRATPTWTPYSYTFTATSATPGYLIFVWESAAGNPNPPSACVDNIVIYEGEGPCAATPTGLRYTNGQFVWNAVANATGYEVMLFNSLTETFSPVATVATASWTPSNPGSGHCIVYVRALCTDGGHSEWATLGKFMYDPSEMCVDYLDLGPDNTHVGTTYIGEHSNTASHASLGWWLGIRDNDTDDLNNLHGLQTIKGEYDPIVGGVYPLKTIPDGSIASVRLGSLYDPGQNARVEYKYKVTADKDLLDFKYAIVLEDGGHASNNPFVQLEILDGNGQPLASTCTQFEFVAAFGSAANWHHATLPTPGASASSSWYNSTIYWQDWDSVTVSLRPYIGQTLTIRVTASRCVFDTHITYCYFAFNCRSAAIEGVACGDTSTDRFIAPAGFSYRWYRESDPTMASIQSTDPNTLPYADNDTLHLAQTDTCIYMLECHNIKNPTCYTSVPLNPNPRYPKAMVTQLPKEADCTNDYSFSNNSYVEIITRNTEGKRDTTIATGENDVIDGLTWDWGDGSPMQAVLDSVVHHSYPRTGGQYHVVVTASMSGGECTDTQEFDLELPDLTVKDILIPHRFCQGDTLSYTNSKGEEMQVTDNYIDTITSISPYGCEIYSIHKFIRRESFVDPTDTVEICDDRTYVFGPRQIVLSKSGFYADTLPSITGCDSIISVQLTVNPKLKMDIKPYYIVCPEDEFLIPFTVLNGDYDAITVQSSQRAKNEGFADSYDFEKAVIKKNVMKIALPNASGTLDDYVRPGEYDFTIVPHSHYPACESPSIPVKLLVKYSSHVIVQRGSYLMLYDADHNGGFDNWVAYQWYYNGSPVVGYTSSQILIPDTSATATYYCEITDAEGHTYATCPVQYEQPQYVDLQKVNTIAVAPTLLAPGETIYISQGGRIELYDALGRLVKVEEKDASAPAQIKAPVLTGLYLLRVGDCVTRIIVK